MAEIGHDYELVVIGGGNMGAALLGGLLRDGIVTAEQVAVVELSDERRQVVAAEFPQVLVSESIPTCRAAVLHQWRMLDMDLITHFYILVLHLINYLI